MKKALQYVEIDIDYCSLSYGVGECPAVLGVDSAQKCFNTFKTCPVQASFANQPRTIRFAEPTEYLPGDIECFPSIKSISYTSQKIEPGISMGERASVSIVFTDHPDSDTFLDKYVSERDYNPFEQGTFFGKFAARNRYIKGRPLRLIMGLLGQTLDQMEVRYFMVETNSGPGTDGQFRIVAKDILKIADSDRAQAPRKSNGLLFGDLSDSATSFTLDPAGIGDLEYPASGHVAIGEEIVSFTRAGDVMTIVRGRLNTTAEEHDDGDLAQLVLSYSADKPSDIIYDLLVTYAEADPAQIPLEEWEYEIDQYINRVYGGHIAKPTGVKDLINELIEQVGLVFWWDDESNQIKLRTLRPVTTGDQLVTDNSLLQQKLKVTPLDDKRVSQVWTSFAQLNPLEDLERQANYASGVVTVDGQSEIDHGMPAIKKVYSRWMDRFNRSGASRLNAQILSRYRDPPRAFDFTVDRFQNKLRIGRGFRLQSWALQDPTGASEIVNCIVTSLTPSFDTYQIKAEEMLFFQRDDLEDQRLIVIDQNSLNLNLRDVHDSIYTAPEGTEDILFVIESGVIVGSSYAAAYALDVGDWPPGTTISLTNFGRIQGKGGDGGRFFNADTNGGAGGPALRAERAITIDNTTGEIWGGGGGGGGGWEERGSSAGGGGGAGSLPGVAGAMIHGGDGINSEIPSTNGTTEAGGSGGHIDPKHASNVIAGNGGGPGLAGSPGILEAGHTGTGGAAGAAVVGDGNITWTGTGDRRGSIS